MRELTKNNLVNSLEEYLNTVEVPYRDKEVIKNKFERIRQNILVLLRNIENRLIDNDNLKRQLREQGDLLVQPFRIFVAGEFSKGKSYLINVLCGNETVRETNIGPQDNKITILAYGDSKDNTSSKYVDVKHYPFEFLKVCNLVDSPGVNAVLRPEHTKITRENVASANMVLFVTSAERTISNEEIELIKFISENNKSEIVFVINKNDVFEDSLINFVDKEGMQTLTRFLEQTLVKETNIRDPFLFSVSTRRAMWALINNNQEVWNKSGMQDLINFIGATIKSGDAAILKLSSPLNFINGNHLENQPILQALSEKHEMNNLNIEKSKQVIGQVNEDIKHQLVEIHEAIDSFDIAEVERSFESSLDLFIERFLSPENLNSFKRMTKQEQEKYVQRELSDTFKDWETGVDNKKLQYIDQILKKFEFCWNMCKNTLKQEKSGLLNSLIDDRERREGQTIEESFNFEKQNSDLVKRFSILKDEIKNGNQKAFANQVLNTHNTIEKNATIWNAVSAASLIGAITGVVVDLFISGGIISLVSILGGGAGALGGFAFRDQRAKKIKEKMQAGIDQTFEAFRLSFKEKIRDVFHEEANFFESRVKKIFVIRLLEIIDEKDKLNKDEYSEVKQLTNNYVVLKGEIEDLNRMIKEEVSTNSYK